MWSIGLSGLVQKEVEILRAKHGLSKTLPVQVCLHRFLSIGKRYIEVNGKRTKTKNRPLFRFLEEFQGVLALTCHDQAHLAGAHVHIWWAVLLLWAAFAGSESTLVQQGLF